MESMPDSEESIRNLRREYATSLFTRMDAVLFTTAYLSSLFRSACGYDLELAQWVFNTFKMSREHVWGWWQCEDALIYACRANKLDTVKWLTTDLRDLPLDKNEFYYGCVKYFVLFTIPFIALCWFSAAIIVLYIIFMLLFGAVCKIKLDKFMGENFDGIAQCKINIAYPYALFTGNFELIEYMTQIYTDTSSFDLTMHALLHYKQYDVIVFLLTRFTIDEHTINLVMYDKDISHDALKYIFTSCPALSKYENVVMLLRCKSDEERAMWLEDREPLGPKCASFIGRA
jgi:hypothetical protein